MSPIKIAHLPCPVGVQSINSVFCAGDRNHIVRHCVWRLKGRARLRLLITEVECSWLHAGNLPVLPVSLGVMKAKRGLGLQWTADELPAHSAVAVSIRPVYPSF